MKENNNNKNENQDDVKSKDSKQKSSNKVEDNTLTKLEEKTAKKTLDNNTSDNLIHESKSQNNDIVDNKKENNQESKTSTEQIQDTSSLTKEEKEAIELEKLQSQLKEIDVHELINKKEEEEKAKQETPLAESSSSSNQETSKSGSDTDGGNKIETEEVKTEEQKGEIEIQVLSSKELEIQQNIDVIKQELKANKTLKERFKDLFKSKSLKQKEEELITKKAIKAQQKSKSKKEVKFILTKFNSTIGWFSVFYSRSDMKWRILIAFIVGLVMSFVSIVMIQNTGVIVSGMSGIFQGIARITKTAVLKGSLLNEQSAEVLYTSMFYGFYLVVSIPLIIFSYFKIGKNFTILSSIPVVVSTVVPLLINLIPGTKELFVFGNTRPEVLKNMGSGLSIEKGELNKFGVQILTFVSAVNSNGAFITDGSKFGFMFMYTAAAGLLNGLAYSMALAVGGSTGGLDFVSFYYSYKKNKSIGKMLLFFNMGSVLLTSIIGAYIPAIIADGNASYERFFSQNLVSGIIYSILVALVINLLFPKDKAVKITIYSEKAHKIRDYLYSKNFNHSLTINTTTGGYSMTEKKNIEIICMFIEIPRILREIRYCDIDTLVTITPLKGIEGKLRIENSIN